MDGSILLGVDATGTPRPVLVDPTGQVLISGIGGPLGSVTDGGPTIAGVPFYLTSADISGAGGTAICAAPGAASRSKLLQVTISCLVAMELKLIEETSATVHNSWFIPANGSVIFVPRYPETLPTVNKRWMALASVAGNVRITSMTVAV